MKINATLSIIYSSTGGVSVRIEDRASGIEFVDLEISHEEFSKALSSLHGRPATECEVRGLKNVGKPRQTEQFKMYFEGELPNKWKDSKAAEAVLIEEATRQGLANDGWAVSAYWTLHSKGGSGKDADERQWYKMSRTRYVEDETNGKD